MRLDGGGGGDVHVQWCIHHAMWFWREKACVHVLTNKKFKKIVIAFFQFQLYFFFCLVLKDL